MEAVLFIGIQGSGKTAFYAERFLKTHLRISLDLLKTGNKEWQFYRLCLETGQKLLIDNTNPTIVSRAAYIAAAKTKNFRIIGYYFNSTLTDAIERNKRRIGKELVKEVGIRATYKKFQMPALAEGFDELYEVTISDNKFCITELG